MGMKFMRAGEDVAKEKFKAKAEMMVDSIKRTNNKL